MLCSIANLATTTATHPSKVMIFFYIIGGADMLSLLGSRMLFHLKETGTRMPTAKRPSFSQYLSGETDTSFAGAIGLDTMEMYDRR